MNSLPPAPEPGAERPARETCPRSPGACSQDSFAGDARQVRCCPVRNRIGAILLHIPWYSVDGMLRLARDIGVPPSTICRLLSGQSSPSFALVWKVKEALEKRLGRSLEFAELFSLDGSYPTASLCTLCGCSGCLPDAVYDEEGNRKAAFAHVKPGRWGVGPDGSILAVDADGKEER